jgi:hypothetical protein
MRLAVRGDHELRYRAFQRHNMKISLVVLSISAAASLSLYRALDGVAFAFNSKDVSPECMLLQRP